MDYNPDVGVRNSLTLSKEMKSGYKWKIFVFKLSFIGWSLLPYLTLAIGLIWLVPCMKISMPNFYDNVRESAANKGIFAEDFQN